MQVDFIYQFNDQYIYQQAYEWFFSVINNGNSKYLSHTPDICMALDLYESVDGALSHTVVKTSCHILDTCNGPTKQ